MVFKRHVIICFMFCVATISLYADVEDNQLLDTSSEMLPTENYAQNNLVTHPPLFERNQSDKYGWFYQTDDRSAESSPFFCASPRVLSNEYDDFSVFRSASGRLFSFEKIQPFESPRISLKRKFGQSDVIDATTDKITPPTIVRVFGNPNLAESSWR